VASVNWRKRGKRYLVYWRADDGSQGGKTVDTEDQARLLQARMLLELTSGTWTARQRGKLTLAHWDAEWWQVWSAVPGRSPNTLAATESRRRCHVLPQLGRRPVDAITPKVLRQWQNQVAGKVGYETVMACRSIVFRILKFAEDEGAIPANPMRKVPAPDPPVDPDEIFGDARRRAYTPEEAGQLLAYFPRFWWDHVITLLGTGMRFGEFAGLHKRRVLLDRAAPVVQVVDTRYQAGRFGSGFKPRPKSRASVREIPLTRQVVEAIRRQLPPSASPDTLVFAGPGGGNSVQAGTRTVLSRDNFRRIYHAALAKLGDPAAIDLRPTARRVLAALRADGSPNAEELTTRLGGRGRALKLATVQAAVCELEAAGLVIADVGDGARWTAQPPPGNDMLDELELHGPHDFRHTLSTWLEEAGIPARVIDEIMGHQSGQTSRRSPRDSGSRIGTRYRHTTPEMAARAVAAIEERLSIVLKVAREITSRDLAVPCVASPAPEPAPRNH
jgi:integrase